MNDFHPIERDELFARLAACPPGAQPATAVLCAGKRLAQHLHEAYARERAAGGAGVWATPQILTTDVFLHEIAESLRPRRALAGAPLAAPLSAAESDLLWRLVVSESSIAPSLLREGDSAELAGEAWALCRDHGIRLPLPAVTPDVECFNAWAAAYRSRCERLGRVDARDFRAQLLALIESGAASLPQTLVLAGFDRVPPWVAQLCAALSRAGCALSALREPQHVARIRAGVAASGEQELRAAAEWVLETARAHPHAHIGVVVPDLGARRADLLRVFDQTLCPQLDAADAEPADRPYNLSLGDPLSALGLVHCALSLLRLCVEGLDLAEAGSLLCSPYWGADEAERLARADLDRRLREEGHLRVDGATLARVCRDAGLRARFEQLRGVRGNADASQWAERFSDWLRAAGWPGPRPLGSVEFQTLDAWRELLGNLGALGGVLGPVAASGALSQLWRLAQQRVFQPQTPPVEIQVLGALEAQGLDFDALWVMGLDDERWPPPGRPNPFIPFELQRRLDLPHASTAVELAWAERMTERWRGAAAEVVLSWAAAAEDRPLSPSPLIQAEAARAEPLLAAAIAPAWALARQAAREERIADAYAPAPDLALPLPGGSRLLGDQARCPFRAFAMHRLGARALEQPGYGPSYADRGELVHRALETLWRGLRTHAGLAAFDEPALAQRVAGAVDAALERLAQRAPQRLPLSLRTLERERLCRLIVDWLALERERPPFVVEWIEGTAPESDVAAAADAELVRFDELLLRLRPDRIDRLEDGRRLVLDYKTGARKPPPWHDGRPEEPQLLLYALTSGDVAGLAYARLTAGAIGFDGLGADEALAPGLRHYAECRDTRDATSWTALMGRWRGELETLAGEVRRGLAAVTPKHPRQSCNGCHLHASCRIHEALSAAGGEDE